MRILFEILFEGVLSFLVIGAFIVLAAMFPHSVPYCVIGGFMWGLITRGGSEE